MTHVANMFPFTVTFGHCCEFTILTRPLMKRLFRMFTRTTTTLADTTQTNIVWKMTINHVDDEEQPLISGDLDETPSAWKKSVQLLRRQILLVLFVAIFLLLALKIAILLLALGDSRDDFKAVTPRLNISPDVLRSWAMYSPYYPAGRYPALPSGCTLNQVCFPAKAQEEKELLYWWFRDSHKVNVVRILISWWCLQFKAALRSNDIRHDSPLSGVE